MKNGKIKNLWQHYSYEIKNCINDIKTPGRRKKQIPNILTSSRIIAPFFIVPLFFLGLSEAAIALTCVSASTDFFDGMLARKLDARSEFGKELDPVSDKVFASGLLISLSAINPLILINLGLEAVIAGTNFISKLKDNEPKTHMLGKIKTWCLSGLVILNFLSIYMPINNILNLSTFTITTILQVGSAAKYIYEDTKKEKIKKSSNTNINQIIENNTITNKKEKCKSITNDLKMYRNILENSNRKTDEYGKSLHL